MHPILRDFIEKSTPSAQEFTYSFEFFPPKNDELEAKLWQVIRKLEPLEPSFVSVTYGAGGSTRERTHQTIERIIAQTNLKPAAHLTCVSATKEEVNEVIRHYWDVGVRHIVALRGDAPEGQGKYQPTPGGYDYAVDLVKGIREIGDFEISVAAYPEAHPEAESLDKDIEYLKRKFDAGATRAITQYFFDTDVYLRFLEKCHKAGITQPIVPGILPVTNYSQMVRFSKMCGASIPNWVRVLLEPLADEPELYPMIAATIAVEQCRLLAHEGVEHMHFYTLNRAELTYAITHILRLAKA